jgi:hypothetical protein
MINLAGVEDCDRYIRKELERCRILTFDVPRTTGEVAFTVEGRLGGFEFRRAWTYWVVRGRMPLHIANKLYADPIGKDDIRVAGHCGCVGPVEPWITWLGENGKQLATMADKRQFERMEAIHRNMEEVLKTYEFVEDPTLVGKPFIMSYHIDSEAGLRIFADMVRQELMKETKQ